jgi:hypothetical protein
VFRIQALQHWNSLSDVAADKSLYYYLPFIRFVSFSLDHDGVPDSSTICRFRQNLLEKGSSTFWTSPIINLRREFVGSLPQFKVIDVFNKTRKRMTHSFLPSLDGKRSWGVNILK